MIVRAGFTGLSTATHLREAGGNADLSRFSRDLLSRSVIEVSVYEPATQSICAIDEQGNNRQSGAGRLHRKSPSRRGARASLQQPKSG